MKLSTLIYIFALLSGTALSAQVVPYEKYTSKSGLISDRITTITQDEKGFMWFGSYFGISRYDGIKFENMALPEHQQNKYVTFLISSGGKLYAGFLFQGGLAEFRNGRVNSYFVTGKDSSLASEFVCATANEDSSLYLCNSAKQVYHFRNGRFTYLSTLRAGSGSPKIMLKDRNQNIWIASENGLTILPPPYRKEYLYFTGQNIFCLAKDADQKIWMAKADQQSSTISLTDSWEKGRLVNYQVLSQSTSLRSVPFAGNLSNGIWLADEKHGLVNLKKKEHQASYAIPLDFNTDITTVFTDRESNVWIANDPGVYKISRFGAQSFLFGELTPGGGNMVMAGSAIWASSSKALYRIENGRIQKEKITLSRPQYIGTLHVDGQSNLWLGLWEDGLEKFKINNGKLTSEKFFVGFGGRKIKAQTIVEDKLGNLWVGGYNGIFHIRGNQVVDHYQPRTTAGQPAFITCMNLDEDNQTMWLGDNTSGLIKLAYRIKPDGTASYKISGYIHAKQGLKDHYVRSMLIDHRKNIWVGTRFGGIFCVREETTGIKVTDYTRQAKLSCTRIMSISMEDTSRIWFATCNGIFSYHLSRDQWNQFNTSNGLLNAEVFAVKADPKTRSVWALTTQGLSRIQTNINNRTAPPLINITGVSVSGKPDSNLYQSSPQRYSYNDNSIAFSFASTSFIDERKIRYRYMLVGFDQHWSEEVFSNHVNYVSLPPGRYAFKVTAANANGEWSAQPAVFEFEIVRPFYRDPWFIFSIISVLLLIFYLIRTARLQHQYKIEKLRLSIARDLHDDVGSTLGSINLLSKTASRRLGKTSDADAVQPIFQKIGQSAENTLEAMDDIVWSINPEKDKAHDLVIRMREFAIPLFEANNIEFDFSVEGNEDHQLPMNLRRNVFLIFKETVYNILKHAQATKVMIRLEIIQGKIVLKIQDNGKGFAPRTASNRNGLKNVYNRAESVGANLLIDSSALGTSLHFTALIR